MLDALNLNNHSKVCSKKNMISSKNFKELLIHRKQKLLTTVFRKFSFMFLAAISDNVFQVITKTLMQVGTLLYWGSFTQISKKFEVAK